MNNHDHSDNEQETPVIPTVQDRRRQLEAFQAERARHKSLGASVRGPIRSNPLGVSQFGRSYRPQRSIGPSGASQVVSQGSVSTDNCEDYFPESNAKKIIQHFDALSWKTDRPTDKTFLGIRRHGAAPHRIEKKPTPGRSTANANATASPFISYPQRPEPGQGAQLDMDQHMESERIRLSLSRSHIQTKQASFPSIREARSVESRPRSMPQERHSTPGKSQEEIYLAQAQLLQLYMKQKRLDETFLEQEQAIQIELDAINRATSAKQAEVLELKEKLDMEQDLIFLDDNLGVQKDKMLEIIEGLEGYRKGYEDFTLAFEREGRVSGVSRLETENLDRWLAQTREFQSAADATLKSLGCERVVVQGIVRTLSGLNSVVKQELDELKECSDLITKISQTEAAEISLSSL
ncbi:hypothetical protein BGZ81_006909 [Podila clonocystis]|nr:hypothetical protein BGZ81_006909 [Podila clonocystis]